MKTTRILALTLTFVTAVAAVGGANPQPILAAEPAPLEPAPLDDETFASLVEETQPRSAVGEWCPTESFPGGWSCTCNCFWDGCSVNCVDMPECYCKWGVAHCECDNPWPPPAV